MKECKNSIVPPLTTISRKSLQESVLPDIWKQANVTAIYKKGDKTKPENYRPISLTSVPCKLMKRIMRNQIVEHMTRNNFFSPFQHRFISGKSCVTQLLEYLEDLTEALDQDEDVDIIYLDFSKDFDKLPHRKLMKKSVITNSWKKCTNGLKNFWIDHKKLLLMDNPQVQNQ